MPIEIDDALLEESPYGNLLLAIAETIDALQITPLDAIRIEGYGDEPKGQGPELLLLPLPEEPLDGRHLGRINRLFTARVVMLEKSDPTECQTLGWHTKQRDTLLRRLGGDTQQGATLTRGDYCFTLQHPTFGPFYDDQSRQRGFIRSEFAVRGEYRGA